MELGVVEMIERMRRDSQVVRMRDSGAFYERID